MLDVSTSLTTVGNSGCLTWVRHSSPKSSATHSYLCVQHFPVSKQRYGCQRLGFVTCAQMLMHATAHGGRTNTVRESALKLTLGENTLQHGAIKPASVLRLFFSVRCSTTLSPPHSKSQRQVRRKLDMCTHSKSK